MSIFVEVEGIRVNKFTFWLDFKIIMDFELEFLEDKEIWKCFEFLRASNYQGKFQEIRQKFSLDEMLSDINLYGTTCTEEFEDPFACGFGKVWSKFGRNSSLNFWIPILGIWLATVLAPD
jgi:hypothetical protein